MARKLFPSYGSALANSMLATLHRERVVGSFVAAYVSEYGRRAILGGPSRDRELAETIGREAMLAMIHEAIESLPRFFARSRRGVLREEEKEAMDAFCNELMATLERAWRWDREDRRLFRRDLLLYSEFGTGPAKPRVGKRAKKVQPQEPHFIGRVALLLDPSMLEQARRAATKLHSDLKRLANKLLRKTLSQTRTRY